jgi:hypothetical protein
LITAEELVSEVRRMPPASALNFFSLLGEHVFSQVDWTHEQVFGHLDREMFSAQEAAEYIEISLPSLRRYVQPGRLQLAAVVGRNQFFKVEALRAFKRARNYA